MTTRLACVWLLVFAAVSPVLSQPLSQPPVITVSGSAEVKVAPDEIFMRVGVETFHDVLAEAKKENDERVERVLAFLKSSDIQPADIQTDYLAVEPRYEDYPTRRKFVHHVVQRSIEVKIKQVDAFEGILAGVLTNGVTHVHGIDFRTSELRKHRDTARGMATRAAREKADALAAELGVRRGKVYNINANEWGGWWSSSAGHWGHRYGAGMFQNTVQNAGGGAPAGDSTLSLGQISISATVNVSFLIEE
jgi:uncharacterized protein